MKERLTFKRIVVMSLLRTGSSFMSSFVVSVLLLSLCRASRCLQAVYGPAVCAAVRAACGSCSLHPHSAGVSQMCNPFR